MSHPAHIPNHRKLWRIRAYHARHADANDFLNAFTIDNAFRIRNRIGSGLVSFFTWIKA